MYILESQRESNQNNSKRKHTHTHTHTGGMGVQWKRESTFESLRALKAARTLVKRKM
jgi:hypothetical protein